MSEGETMKIDELSKAIERELTLQMETSTDAVKNSIREVATEVRDEIQANAPVGASGDYAGSWRTKPTEETMTSITYTVYATKKGYPLAHLLEFGHAKRGGGRTRALPHIKPAEDKAVELLEDKIRRGLS